MLYMTQRDRDALDSREPAQRTTAAALPIAELLAFEARNPGHSGPKEDRIRVELRMTSARYYQQLHAAVDTREALELDPLTVNRVLRQREQARQHRRDVSTARRA